MAGSSSSKRALLGNSHSSHLTILVKAKPSSQRKRSHGEDARRRQVNGCGSKAKSQISIYLYLYLHLHLKEEPMNHQPQHSVGA